MDKNSDQRRSQRKPIAPSRLNYSKNFNQNSSNHNISSIQDVREKLRKLKSSKKDNSSSQIVLKSSDNLSGCGVPPRRVSTVESDKLSGPSDKFFPCENSFSKLSSRDPITYSFLNLSEPTSSATSISNPQIKMGDNNDKNMEKVFELIAENNTKLMSEMMKKMAEMMNQSSNIQSSSGQGAQEKEMLHSNSKLNQREAVKIHPWLTNVRQFDSSITKMPTECSKIGDLVLIQAVICWIRKNCVGLSDHQKFLLQCIESIPNFNALKPKPDEANPSLLSRTLSWVDIEMSDDKSTTNEVAVKSMINDIKIAMVSERSTNTVQDRSFSGFAKPIRYYDKTSKNSKNAENFSRPPQPCFSWNDGNCKHGSNCHYAHVCTKCWKKGKICRKRRSACDGEEPDFDSEEE